MDALSCLSHFFGLYVVWQHTLSCRGTGVFGGMLVPRGCFVLSAGLFGWMLRVSWHPQEDRDPGFPAENYTATRRPVGGFNVVTNLCIGSVLIQRWLHQFLVPSTIISDNILTMNTVVTCC